MCLLETMLLICCLLLPSRYNVKKTNDERTLGAKSAVANVTINPLSIRNSPHLKVSIRIYSYLKVREGNKRDVVRIYWYLSALCRFDGTHQSADIRIYPQ